MSQQPLSTVPAPPIGATDPTPPPSAERDSFVLVAQATRSMIRRAAAVEHGTPTHGAAGVREWRVVLALVWELTTWNRLEDRLAATRLAARARITPRTLQRAVARLESYAAITRTTGGLREWSTYGLPRLAVAEGAAPPAGDRVDLATVSAATRRFIDRVLRANLTRSALTLAGAIIAELTTWARIAGAVNRAHLQTTYGLSRSSLRRAYRELADLGVITATAHDRRGDSHVAVIADAELEAAAQPPRPIEVLSAARTPYTGQQAETPAPPAPLVPDAAPKASQGNRAAATVPFRRAMPITPAMAQYAETIRSRVIQWDAGRFVRELDAVEPTSLLWKVLARCEAAGWHPSELASLALEEPPATARSWVGLLIYRLEAVSTTRRPSRPPACAPEPMAHTDVSPADVGPDDPIIDAAWFKQLRNQLALGKSPFDEVA